MNLKGFDVELHKGWQDGMVRRLQEVREQDSDHWWRLYNRYLESPEWKAKRRAVLERDSFVCQGCQNARATQVHHLTYKRKGREMLFDLVAVCDDCHCEIHAEESSEE